MKRYLLKYFAWISLALALTSCQAPRITMSGKQDVNASEIRSSNAIEKITCKALVSFRGKELSGQVMIKKDKEDLYRVAFYNEMGMTFLQGTLDNNRMIVENIIPALDNKVFLRKFRKALNQVIE